MAKTTELYEQAVGLSTTVDENFLELASALRDLQEADPDEFRRAINNSGLGARKAYYLVEIDKVFSKIPVPKLRLKKIGWTKLNTLSKHINKSNYAELLKQAETHTNKELETLLRGETVVENQRAVLAYFSPADYAVFEEALLLFKGLKQGRGIVNKEEAMMNMARYVLKHKPPHTAVPV